MGPTSTYQSILYDSSAADAPDDASGPPEYFADLHIDDIVNAVTAGREFGATREVFYRPLHDADAISYRHDVFRDLEDDDLAALVRDFGQRLQTVQARLTHASKATYDIDGQRWLLYAADSYKAAVDDLNVGLADATLTSTGMLGFRDFLATYTKSDGYTKLVSDSDHLKDAVAGIHYRLRIDGARVIITRFAPEPDYEAEVLATFAKFQQGSTEGYDWRFTQDANMNHVEAAIFERVARLYPEPFEALRLYASEHQAFLDPTITRFEQESRFYLAYRDHMDRLRHGTQLEFCYPNVTAGSHHIEGLATFDLALAGSLVPQGTKVVTNDVTLSGPERIIVVSGPNSGGKTTFARAIGQLHHLARIGVPVPGKHMRLPLVDQIFTHFEREEQVDDLSSKLESDLRRIHMMLEQATSASLLIMNESFSSTTVQDQLFVNRRIMRQVMECDLLCVFVTFLDELSVLGPATVSMVSTVDSKDAARRTFEIVRRPADGLAYALAIAQKHRLTYVMLKARLTR